MMQAGCNATTSSERRVFRSGPRGVVSRSALLLAGIGLLAVGVLLVDRPPVERAIAAYQDETVGRVLLQYGGSNTLVSQIVVAKTGDPAIRHSFALTIVSCSITTVLALVVAIPLGYLLSQHHFRGRQLVDAILDIPLVLPPLVLGISLLILFQPCPLSAHRGPGRVSGSGRRPTAPPISRHAAWPTDSAGAATLQKSAPPASSGVPEEAWEPEPRMHWYVMAETTGRDTVSSSRSTRRTSRVQSAARPEPGVAMSINKVRCAMQVRRVITLLLVAAVASPPMPVATAAPPAADERADVVIYGGTSAAVVAAVQAAAMGASVVVVSPDKHLGGLSSGGLGWTDGGKTGSIGGLAREFYRRVFRHYAADAAWKWRPRSALGTKGQSVGTAEDGRETMWVFEPHVAEKIFDDWIAGANVKVVREALLDRDAVVLETSAGGQPRIATITTLAAGTTPRRTYAGKVFIDATYEGDLMAAAKVSHHVGRESNATYGEEWNGNQVGVLHHVHHWKTPVDPYRVPGDPGSGLLPRISPDPPGVRGEGDRRVQAYCFRMCLTNVPENRVPFPKPAGYDPAQYELLARTLASGWNDVFGKFDPIPNGKTDTNNHGPFSTDNIGMNDDYPEASYERRREIIREHETYQQGLMWFLANDERVPAAIREAMSQWGLPRDEFTDNGHWSHQLYIREARRMVGEEVMTEHHTLSTKPVARPVGMGSYALDSHNVRRYVIPAADGKPAMVQNEGDIGVKVPKPYAIGYGCVVPQRAECANLLVPVCVSASHIAYGSIRMEPVFMILGQSAATAAVIAAREGLAVQDVPYDRLRERLLADGQVLEVEAK